MLPLYGLAVVAEKQGDATSGSHGRPQASVLNGTVAATALAHLINQVSGMVGVLLRPKSSQVDTSYLSSRMRPRTKEKTTALSQASSDASEINDTDVSA